MDNGLSLFRSNQMGRSSALRSLFKADKDALGLIGDCMHARWKPTKERASGD